MTEYIKKADLEIGTAYEVDGMNFSVAIWDGELFHGVAYIQDQYYMTIEYPTLDVVSENDDGGTCRALRMLE